MNPGHEPCWSAHIPVTDFLAWHASSLWTCLTIAGLCLALVTITGPDLWPCPSDWLLSFPSDLPRHHKLNWRSGLSTDCCCHHSVHPACLAQDWAVGWQGPCPSNLITFGSQLPIPLLLPDRQIWQGKSGRTFTICYCYSWESLVLCHITS